MSTRNAPAAVPAAAGREHKARAIGLERDTVASADRLLISFDIDGTLSVGDPPGPITLPMVAEAQARGHVIGSASDRTLSEQRQIWTAAGISVDFMCNKHLLPQHIAGFGCRRMLHIGDTTNDEYYAGLAGLEFVHVNAMTSDWSAFLADVEQPHRPDRHTGTVGPAG
jgi:hypothetical protein